MMEFIISNWWMILLPFAYLFEKNFNRREAPEKYN